MDQQIQVLYFSMVTKRGDDWRIKEILVIEAMLFNKTPQLKLLQQNTDKLVFTFLMSSKKYNFKN